MRYECVSLAVECEHVRFTLPSGFDFTVPIEQLREIINNAPIAERKPERMPVIFQDPEYGRLARAERNKELLEIERRQY